METKYIINQQFLVEYEYHNIKVFEITLQKQLKIYFEFKDENEITNIEFNPSVNTIMLVSYYNGTCKIFNILNRNEKNYILFEGINNSSIIYSKFNYFNPNIIASLSKNNTIMIWDVRQLSLLQIIDNNSKDDDKKVINFKWSFFGNNMIELKSKKGVRLIDIESKIEIAKYEDINAKDFLFLNQNHLLIFKRKSIEKIDIKAKKKVNEINFNTTYIVNFDLIQSNYLILMSNENMLFIYEASSFSEIEKIKFELNDDYYFFNIINNKISSYSFCNTLNETINAYIINLINNFEGNKCINKENIENNFYVKYEKIIYKYMSLLNFKENSDKNDLYFEKNYMNIDSVITFFNEAKKIDIFSRKEIVDNILNNINNNEEIAELSMDKFKELAKFSNVIVLKDLSQRKEEMIKIISQIINPETIKELYIEIAKLLSLDNTNASLLSIYLLFINSYEDKLINYFKEENIEKYEKEIKYYEPCFSKEEFKILFNLYKQSEKDIVLNFINQAYSIKNYNYDNPLLKNFVVEKLKDISFPKFNQPIEFDCPNEELKWHLLKVHIFSTFKNLKLIKKEQDKLGRLKKGIILVKENELLTKEDIIKDKNKLQASVYLITNPCDAKDLSGKFVCNLILSKRNTKEQLEKKFNIKIENIKDPLKYKDTKYNDCEFLCLENLDISSNDFVNEEKYNFNYLIDKFEEKQKKIKAFMKNILVKQTFVDAYNILFGDGNYKLKDPKYLEEFIENRLKFIPSRPFSTLAISNKISLNTCIIIKPKNIVTPNNLTESILNNLKEILNIGGYVVTEEHEIFHLLDCLPYYENNCGVSRDTPRKRFYDGESEGGEYLELLLFDKIFKEMNLNEILFILNEDNYDKPLIQFKEDFKKLNPEDLVINGEFSYFNEYLDNNEVSQLNHGEVTINLKEAKIRRTDFKIKIFLEDDVIGRMKNN